MSVLDDARLRDLLREADSAISLISQRGDPSGEVTEALDSLYRDLGKHLHTLLQQPADESRPKERVPQQAESTSPDPDEEPHFESDGWYTDEVDGDALPLFTEGELDDESDTDIPESDALTASGPDPVEMDDLDVMSLPTLRADANAPDGELARLRVGREPPPWGDAVTAFVELLAPPEDLLAASAMPEEASKVQWAAGVIDKRLPGWPTTVQSAILGMLAARALNLCAHLDVDVGPRRAIDRMKRYRSELDLPYVAGLLPGPHPENDTWAEDAVAFWHLLRPHS